VAVALIKVVELRNVVMVDVSVDVVVTVVVLEGVVTNAR
jgi:hypothetical protein